MRGTVSSRLRAGSRRLARDQRGNAMMLTAAAIVPVIGIVGSAIDIGRAYMAQLRLQQACDAGVLAGRRAMSGADYSAAAKAEANKMFAFNFPSGNYGSTNIGFASQAQGASNVSGSASARLPTVLMHFFGTTRFDLSVACTAKLEISNVDVMMVLDVTGSMASANSGDAVTKIVALRAAAIDFFATLTSAQAGDGRLRFGVVPYSSSVNVGQILLAKNPDWLSGETRLPSRTPVVKVTYGNASTIENPNYVDTPLPEKFDKDLGKCKGGLPANTEPQPGSPKSNLTAQYIDGSGNRITTYDVERTYSYYTYRLNETSGCREERWIASFKRVNSSTVTENPVRAFDGKYVYEDRVFDVSALKSWSTMQSDTGDAGALVTTSWGGCIIERATVAFASNRTAPSDAFDMNIDMVPTSDADTQWKLFLPDVTYDRSGSNAFTSSSDYRNFVERGGDYAACPAAAMKLTTMKASDKASFETYINSLQPRGYTYHDAGMAWGARLLSPDGLFADENRAAPNQRPISRHIIFMTDGDMRTPRGNMSHQGQESSMPRIGATSDDDAIARHNNRFVQLCAAAKAKNITVWVVGFGTSLNSQLTACASSGKAYEAGNAQQLNDNFQAIARQISKLRLSQ